MKFVVFLVVFILSLAAWAGDGTKGGLVVFVEGQWVPFEEATSYLSATFEGISELPTGVPSKTVRALFNKDYGVSLQAWLKYVATLSASQAKGLADTGELVRFVYVDAPLSKRPDDLPDKTPIDFKDYMKAAVYVPSTMDNGTVFVSLPVMEKMGSLGDERLSIKQNQGFMLLHELINAHYQKISANQREVIGQSIIETFIQGLSPAEYGLHLSRRGGPYMQDTRIALADKIAVLNEAKAKNLLGRVKLDGYMVTETDLGTLELLNQYMSDPSLVDAALGSFDSINKFMDKFTDQTPIFGKAYGDYLFEKYNDKFTNLPLLKWTPNIEEFNNFNHPQGHLFDIIGKALKSKVLQDCRAYVQDGNLCDGAINGGNFDIQGGNKYNTYIIASGPSSSFKNWSVINIIVKDSKRGVASGDSALLMAPGGHTWSKTSAEGLIVNFPEKWEVAKGLFIAKVERTR